MPPFVEKSFVPLVPLEELTFQGSAEPTIGLELELQILDSTTGELAPGAQRILDACQDDGLEGVTGEFLLSMLEVRTNVCCDVDEARETLIPLIRRVATIARSLGYHLAMGGTHPFARPTQCAVSPGDRYSKIRKQQGYFALQENIFGLHVHVGVPGGDEAIGLMNWLSPYLPHLLALSSNSPLWEGVDSGFASARAVMFRPSPNVGVPPHFQNWDGFRNYCDFMHRGGIIESTKNLYWDIRPRPGFGTVEFRVFDAPYSLEALFGLAALTRAMVVDGLRWLRRHPGSVPGDQANHWLANENKWLAARYGTKAMCVRRPGLRRLTLGDDTAVLIDRLSPVARELGDGNYLVREGPSQLA